ncbi:hypothetical protein V6S67_14200 [Arthrobacter sp. Soc17.1.1.1]|uniref:hypothetical protein n=1 Tax=Arthrobacter sp. Soc17.1.1.1 TaxID=3121277 RepID=UPI002FE45876
MNTRFLVLLGILGISLGILAQVSGARGYPLLLIAAGGVVLALPCVHRSGGKCVSRHDDGDVAFSMPPVGTCPPERLREARLLAARVVESANPPGAAGTAEAPDTVEAAQQER